MRGRTALALAVLLGGCASVARRPAAIAPVPPPAAGVDAVPKSYRWLHGSGEAAVLQATTWRALTRYALAQAAQLRVGAPVQSAVLAEGAPPEAPRWTACTGRPAAVVFDIDETSLLNTGANYDNARRGDPPFDPARWEAWERTGAPYVEPLPGARPAIAQLRAAGVTPIFISNRRRENAAPTLAALAYAGLGPAIAGQTLLLQGDIAPGPGKDPRRAAIARRWCVLAMAGDQLGDFSDLFNTPGTSVQARRALAQSTALADKWGAGWFLMPNPAYGPGVAGGLDDLFPAAKRWSPPSETR